MTNRRRRNGIETNEGEIRHWIFQANPDRYRIHDSLGQEAEEWWNLNQHADEVRVGDEVAVWISGAEAGVYALGKVVEGPITRPDSARGQGYWRDAAAGSRAKPRVRVRYDRVISDRPLLKVFLLADPDLWDLSVIHAPRGTNFPVRAGEWQRLQNWIDRKSD
jgi:hypothetical protein